MTPFTTILFVGVAIRTTLADQCACATSNVHVREEAGISYTILTTLGNGHCLPYKDNEQQVNNETWVNVDYHGQDAWIHGDYVTINACGPSAVSDVQLPGCPQIVTRAEWGARAPVHPHQPLPGVPRYLFIHHGASAPCYTKTDCIYRVQKYQDWHIDGRGWDDIGYSFIVGEDGNVYEGRGWDSVGAHTKGYNDVGLAICMIGNFMDHLPNEAGLNVVKQMIQCAYDNHKLTNNYTLMGHRDVASTACPGDKYYELIQSWPHYSNHL